MASNFDGDSLPSNEDSAVIAPVANLIFYDGFESGDTQGWSETSAP